MSVNFGQVLERTMKEREETQLEAAQGINVSNSLVSKIIKGQRKPAPHIMRLTARRYDDPMICLAAANEVTDGAFFPYLDNADLHRASVSWKSREEVMEAYEAIGAAPITKRNDQLNAKERAQIKVAIMESMQAMTVLFHEASVLCKDYDFSWKTVCNEHRQKLKEEQYIT